MAATTDEKRKHKIVEEDKGYFLVDKEDPDANYIAASLPGYDFKGVPSFFDVGGICMDPKALRLCTDIFEERYREMKPPPTSICGLDARGFLFGPLVAQRLNIPFCESGPGRLREEERRNVATGTCAPAVVEIPGPAMRCDAIRCDALRCDGIRCDAMRCDAMPGARRSSGGRG